MTQFRNKAVYPVYLTIGNIPKAIRRKSSGRAQILIAYLPTTKLEHVTNKAARRRMNANLFHSCMGRIFAPLVPASLNGIIMCSGDGIRRRNHPIVAAHAADYQDQTLVTGVKNGECPKCEIPHDQLGSNDTPLQPRNLDKILAALALADSDPARFARACADAGIKPIYHPYWALLPFLNIFDSMTPDILHQILQGNLKHLLAWLKAIFGSAELDARCERLPPNHNVRHFLHGICDLSRVTGKEHDQMCRILLGILVDLRLPNNRNASQVIAAVRAMLDFFYLAQYPVHTSETLASLDNALNRFHTHKDIFIELGVRDSFNIPKLHSLRHYSRSIKLFGSTDNYNTQATERLHIDFAKDAYRATNAKDEYPQMTVWLERREKIHRHINYIAWRLDDSHIESACPSPTLDLDRHPRLPKHPSVSSVSLESLIADYGATYIRDALARFVVATNHPEWNARRVEEVALDTFLPFRALPVYHKLKFYSQSVIVDAIHAQPKRQNKRRNRVVPGRFDTGMVNIGGGGKVGVTGNVAQQCRPTASYSTSRLSCCAGSGHLQTPRHSHAPLSRSPPTTSPSCICRVVFTIYHSS